MAKSLQHEALSLAAENMEKGSSILFNEMTKLDLSIRNRLTRESCYECYKKVGSIKWTLCNYKYHNYKALEGYTLTFISSPNPNPNPNPFHPTLTLTLTLTRKTQP